MEDRPTSAVPAQLSVPAPKTQQPPAICMSVGATEDQVSMVGIIPERVNKHGTKIEDLAGTGQHDSMGG